VGSVGEVSEGRLHLIGSMQHVAFFRTCVPAAAVLTWYVAASTDVRTEPDRLFALAAVSFRKSLLFDPTNRDLLESYAESLCASRGEATSEDSGLNYRQRVLESIEMFHMGGNTSGLAAILEKLPSTGDDTYADLCISCWRSLMKVDPHYYQDMYAKKSEDPHVLSSLMKYPTKFGLNRPGSSQHLQEVSAEMFKHVLAINPNKYSKDMNLSWLIKVQSARLVNFFVDRASRSLNMHNLDLSLFPELTAHDLSFAASNLRETKSINLSGLKNLDSEVLASMTKYFEFLSRLVLRDCDKLMDVALETTSESCSRLREIVLSGCVRFFVFTFLPSHKNNVNFFFFFLFTLTGTNHIQRCSISC